MKILVINGPNINMLGIREKNIYGAETYEDLKALLEKTFAEKGVEGEIYQSNHEGDLVDRIQQAYFDGTEGIVINPAAYTHTSVAILDALKAVRAYFRCEGKRGFSPDFLCREGLRENHHGQRSQGLCGCHCFPCGKQGVSGKNTKEKRKEGDSQ